MPNGEVMLAESRYLKPRTSHAERGEDIIALDEALQSLAAIDPRKSRIVELRFFGGLSVDETAEVLNVSPRTVMREWSLAQAWLYRELGGVED